MNKSVLLIAPLLAAFAVSPALADRGGKHGNKGKAKGHDKHQVDHRRGDRDRDRVIRYQPSATRIKAPARVMSMASVVSSMSSLLHGFS